MICCWERRTSTSFSHVSEDTGDKNVNRSLYYLLPTLVRVFIAPRNDFNLMKNAIPCGKVHRGRSFCSALNSRDRRACNRIRHASGESISINGAMENMRTRLQDWLDEIATSNCVPRVYVRTVNELTSNSSALTLCVHFRWREDRNYAITLIKCDSAVGIRPTVTVTAFFNSNEN